MEAMRAAGRDVDEAEGVSDSPPRYVRTHKEEMQVVVRRSQEQEN
jgi:hypothetical protein